jgi:hypothetical protein
MSINFTTEEYNRLEELWERHLYYTVLYQQPFRTPLEITSFRVRAIFYEDQYWNLLSTLNFRYQRKLYKALLLSIEATDFLHSPVHSIPFESWILKEIPHQIIRIEVNPQPRGDHLLADEDIIAW